MQKDVIYIDVEDDITSIIGKVKAADHKIVALVPPKRIGAIQSAVNLKLVQRAAHQVDKRLVIISNNASLTALAASASIPVAKNLQSRPELPEVPAIEVDEGEDVIDGSSDLEASSSVSAKTSSKSEDDAVDAIEADEQSGENSRNNDTISPPKSPTTTAPKAAAAAGALRKRASIPNFDSFRKKMFLGLGLAVFLIGFLVWAILFAPHATILVTAKTADSALNTSVSFSPDSATDQKSRTVKSTIASLDKSVSVPFTATGKKDVGTKATGQVKFYCDSFSQLTRGVTVPAGTQLASSSGKTFVLDSSVSLSVSSGGSGSSNVTASSNGASFNGATGAMNGSGLPSCVSASLASATGGGTDKTITIVSQEDIDKATAEVDKQSDSEQAKKELEGRVGDTVMVVDNTFTADKSKVTSTPSVGAEAADGKATLSGAVTYKMSTIAKSELSTYLDKYFATQIDGKRNQKVYSNGAKDVSFTNVSGDGTKYTANISTNGKIGPIINESELKNFAKGKRYGEIQSHVQATDGVQDVDIKFSPFWVSSAPNDVNKITIQFKVNGA